MNGINALASAGLDRLPDGEWRLHSRFSQAINFVHASGELLTLYRYGKGMGPTGLLLSQAQFACFTPVTQMCKNGGILRGAGLMLYSHRPLRLRLKPGATATLDLSSFIQQSGLCGALNQPLDAMPCYPEIMAGLDRWQKGETPDWSWLIGRGPGLTPSGDDMLTGMMAVFHAAQISLNIFLPSAERLEMLTTAVSCSYLNNARLGEFTTPVLQVMRCLQTGRDPNRALRRLLGVGHTSGADIILGIAIAQRWLQRSDSRGMNARSGNNTHVYSGG